MHTQQKSRRAVSATFAILTIAISFAAASPVLAQPRGGPDMMGPGIMMGPGMMGRGEWRRSRDFCNPGMAGFAEWRIDRIERAVKLTDAQRKALDELRAASKKASDGIAAACPREIPSTATGRMALMEQRMESMLAAIKTVRPAFDAFYATLDDDQKKDVDDTGPRRRGWRSWHWGR